MNHDKSEKAVTVTVYWFVMLKANSPPVAMFREVKEAQAWRNEHYPDASLEKFSLAFED